MVVRTNKLDRGKDPGLHHRQHGYRILDIPDPWIQDPGYRHLLLCCVITYGQYRKALTYGYRILDLQDPWIQDPGYNYIGNLSAFLV